MRVLKIVAFAAISVLFLTSIGYPQQTVFLDHSTAACVQQTPAEANLQGVWFNTAGCNFFSQWVVGGGTCVDGETADGPLQCKFLTCCFYTQWTDHDSRTVNGACQPSSASPQVSGKKIPSGGGM